MSAIDEIKQKIDIAEVVGQYAALKKAGRNLTACCPFHSEKHPSFFVYPEQQSWHCFGACNTGGDVFSFVMKKEGVDFGEALRMLAQRTGVKLPERVAPGERKEEKEALYRVNEAAALYFNNNLLNTKAAGPARKYVEKRGFTERTVADFQLGYSLDAWEALKQYLTDKGYKESDALTAGLLVQSEDGRAHDRFRGKLMIPIKDARGRAIGFGARVLDDSLPKYVNSPQTPLFDKSATLYAIDRAAPQIRQQDAAIIMEGYMDVITAHQHGVTNTVACMGTAITGTQVNALKKLSRNLVLSLDADAAGEEAMLRTVGYENIVDAEMRVIVLPEGKDPDDVIREDVGAWHGLVAGAVPLVDFMFERTAAGYDLSTARDKSLAVDRLLPIVAEIHNPIRQAHYLQKLAGLVKVDLNTIKAALGRLRPPAPGKFTRRPAAPAPGTMKAAPPAAPTSREEYLLALLLQNPGLDRDLVDITEEYFTSSENREIFSAWRTAGDVISIRDRLDPAIGEHFDALIARKLPAADNIEKRCIDCSIELRKKYLKDLAARKAASGEPGDETARVEEDVVSQLREIYARRSRKNNPSASRTRR
jgi:DNA primase